MSRTSKALNEKIEQITQHGAAVPPGYTFNPRMDPPLFKTASTVANEQPLVITEETQGDGEGGDA